MRFSKKTVRKKKLLVIAGLVCSAGLLAQRSGTDDLHGKPPKPFYDAFLASPMRKQLTSEQQRSLETAAKPGTQVQVEERLGVPTFLWASQTDKNPVSIGAALKGKRAEEVAARAYLSRHSRLNQLSLSDIDSATVASIHNTGRGPVIVKFRQSIQGVEVFREELNVAMTQDLGLVAISGYLASGGAAAGFSLRPQEAIAKATADMLDASFSAGDFISAGAAGGYGLYTLGAQAERSRNVRMTEALRAKQVLYRLPDRLVSGYYVEVTAETADQRGSRSYSYVISAMDGQILFRSNLVSDATDPERQAAPYTYRVWAANNAADARPMDGPQGYSPTPHPTGLPDGYQPEPIAPRLVTLTSAPFSKRDPWLASGQTKTIGNNVEAYADMEEPDGFTPNTADIHAETNGLRAFNRVYNTSLQPQSSLEQIQASITHLFFTGNFLHDWFYDSGFDEASGNAQEKNYGRGGVEGDSLRLEAQDHAGRNNADMRIVADGGRPRMQVYLYNGLGDRALTVNSPASIAGVYPIGAASFGTQSFSITNALALVNDGVAAPSVADGCEAPFVNGAALTGKIALIDRGACPFTTKVRNAQASGAVGVLIANNVAGFSHMTGIDPEITIPALMVSLDIANKIKAQLSSNVNVNLSRTFEPDRDGSLDSQLIAHEWGHYLSNRLIANASGLRTNMARGLGEGWSDFVALLMTVRREDSKAPGNSSFNGVYPLSAYPGGGGRNGLSANNAFYFGWRRVPYSTDFAKNSLTFKHISNAVAPPNDTPIVVDDYPNTEVHNLGEVWATMLWECYAALLRDTLPDVGRMSFERAQERMKDYLVASLKMTPPNPTLLEARDALLAVAQATDYRDFALFWEAFAKRGAGTGAVAPDRYSLDNTPVVESYNIGGALGFAGATLSDNVISCDTDGILDAGETGRFSITLRNEGARRLTKTTATVTSTNPNAVFPNGNKVTFAPIRPFETASQSIQVRLKQGSPAKQLLALQISFDDPALDPAGPFTAGFEAYANINVKANSSAGDNVESPVSSWVSTVARGFESWERDVTGHSPFNYAWSGPDPGTVSDLALVSPVLKGGTGPLSITFRHRYAFEAYGSDRFDGGVVEISTDGGSTWNDIGAGYDGTIYTGYDNPLSGKSAYTGTSNSYPEFKTQTINLGTAYKNKNVLIRFRLGSDESISGTGWDIDNISVTGLTNTPFNSIVADTGCR